MNLESILKSSHHNTPEGLDVAIISRVQILIKRKAQRKMFGFGVISAISFVGLITWSKNLWASLQTSGVYDYMSVLASNTSDLSLFWKEILFSILESIPFITISTFLILLVIFIMSSLKAVENIGVKFKPI